MYGVFESVCLGFVRLQVEAFDKVDIIASIMPDLRHMFEAVVLDFDCHCNTQPPITILASVDSDAI